MVKLIQSVDVTKLKSSDTFFLDTNVLCAVHFQTTWSQNKIDVYSSFVQALLMKGITIYVSALSLQEFYHLVEKKEREIYEVVNGKISKKDYRKITNERDRIANELKMIHRQIVSQYTVVDDEIDVDDLDDFLTNYTMHFYDPIDFALVSHHSSSCPNFITDDKDFQTDSSINVYSYS